MLSEKGQIFPYFTRNRWRYCQKRVKSALNSSLRLGARARCHCPPAPSPRQSTRAASYSDMFNISREFTLIRVFFGPFLAFPGCPAPKASACATAAAGSTPSPSHQQPMSRYTHIFTHFQNNVKDAILGVYCIRMYMCMICACVALAASARRCPTCHLPTGWRECTLSHAQERIYSWR